MKYYNKEKNLKMFNFCKSVKIDILPNFEIYKNKNPNIKVVKEDSLEACRGFNNPFVLIFASAKKPGGGVKNGANAQEEAVFRKSSLSQIINKLEPFYPLDYETTDIIYVKDCYQLLDENNQMINPIKFSAGIIPALNLNVFKGSEDEFEYITYNKIISILNCARDNGHKDIILGAFGCGVFKNNPRVIAELFAQILPCYNFENIVFAVLGDNYNTFKEIF